MAASKIVYLMSISEIIISKEDGSKGMILLYMGN